MFQLIGLVEDKNLPKVLHALDGLVLNLQTPPVRNAKVRGGKVVSTADPGGPMAAVMKFASTAKTGERLHDSALLKVWVDEGGAKGSKAYFISKLKKAKIIKPVKGERGMYVKL
jgi:hypothetical protein